MKALLLIVLQISFFSITSKGQFDITKRTLSVDTVKARVDSLYLKGNISLNNQDIYSLFNPFNQSLNTTDTVRFYKQEIGNDKFYLSADTIQGIVNIYSLHEESNSVMNFYSGWDIWFDSENRITINAGDDFFINSFYGNLSFQSNIAKINSSTIGKVEVNPVLYLPDANSWSGTLESGLIRRNINDVEFYNGSEWKSLINEGTSDNVMTFATRTFNDTISFDHDKVSYQPYTITSDITIKKGIITEKYESTASAAFIGNGTNTLTFPANWRNIGDLSYDNTSDLTNYIIFYKQGDRVTYNIYDTLLADLSAPILDSAWQDDSSKVYLLFSENLNQDSVSVMPTSAISLTGATVISFTGSNADTVIVNLSANAVATNVSYTQPSSGKIQDITGNLTSNWTDSTIYDNIPTGTEQSFTINTTNNVTKSGDDYTATANTFNSYCLFNEFLSNSTDGYVIFNYNSIADGTIIIGFDLNNTNKDYTTYDYAIYLAQSTGETRAITNGSLGSIIQNSSTGSKFKLERSGGTVTIEYASDGINFSTIHTFGGSSTEILYVNLNLNSIDDDCRNLLNSF